MILYLPEVGSTNDWLRDNRARLADGQWLRVDRQTAGRGRHGRRWQSIAGNLEASCLVHLQPGEERATDLALVTALAVHDALSEIVAPGRLRLKWPNDVLLDGGKVAGILLERHGDDVIIGIGVNLMRAPDLPGQVAASLDGVVAPGAFCARLADSFANNRRMWREQGFAAVRTRWLALAHPPGARLQTTVDGEKVTGRFAGMGDDGALLLDLPDGSRLTVLSGDIRES